MIRVQHWCGFLGQPCVSVCLFFHRCLHHWPTSLPLVMCLDWHSMSNQMTARAEWYRESKRTKYPVQDQNCHALMWVSILSLPQHDQPSAGLHACSSPIVPKQSGPPSPQSASEGSLQPAAYKKEGHTHARSGHQPLDVSCRCPNSQASHKALQAMESGPYLMQFESPACLLEA